MTSRVYSAKLYADQQKVWNGLCEGKNPADVLRDAMRLYAEQHGKSMPVYSTGGRGYARRGDKKVEVVPVKLKKPQAIRGWVDTMGRQYYSAKCPRCEDRRRLVKRSDGYWLLHCGAGVLIEV